VLLKALEKQPGRRYRSVDALDSEIERYLEGKAVEARRPLPVEMAQRLARRHSGLLLGMFALGASMATGIVQVNPKFVPVVAGMAVSILALALGSAHELGGASAGRLSATRRGS
jgi:hypothetical protein